jgi:hypothetical protein
METKIFLLVLVLFQLPVQEYPLENSSTPGTCTGVILFCGTCTSSTLFVVVRVHSAQNGYISKCVQIKLWALTAIYIYMPVYIYIYMLALVKVKFLIFLLVYWYNQYQ